MEDREVLGRMGEPVDEERERLRQFGVKAGPVPGPPRAVPGRSLV